MESKDAISALSALSQESRLDALRRLVRKGPAGESAGELAATLRIAAPTRASSLSLTI